MRQLLARRAWLGALLVLLLSAPGLVPWLSPDLDLREVDDAKNHLIRLYHLDWLLSHGVWYPRWVPEMFLGYGYPLFNYYAPGFYAVTLLLGAVLRLDLWDAFRASGILAALLGATGSYALVLAVWRRVLAGVLAALGVLYAPYVFQLNLYKRGDLPEALALALLPWLLLAIWRAWHASAPAEWLRWTAAATLLGAAEVLTHNLTALLAALVSAAWVGYLLLAHRRWDGLVRVLLAGAIAVGVTAFFWLPAIAEGGAVQLEWLRAGDLDYRTWLIHPTEPVARQRAPEMRQTRSGPIDLHLLYPHQLVATPKLSLGQAALGLLAIGVVCIAASTWRRERPPKADLNRFAPRAGERDGQPAGYRVHLRAGPIIPFLLVALVCWLMTFTLSIPIWEHVPGLPTFQFPWRFLGPLGVCLALAGGGALAVLTSHLPAGPGTALSVLAIAGVLANGLGAHELPLHPGTSRDVSGRTVVADETQDLRGMGTTSGREFLPRDVNVETYTEGFVRGKTVYETVYPEGDWIGGLFYPFGGDLRVLQWRAAPHRIALRAANDGAAPARVAVHQAYFPGWRAWLDQRPAEIGVAPYVQEQGLSPGFMVLEVPPGEHTIALAFGPTPPRLAGMAISLLAVTLSTGVLSFLTWRRRGVHPLPLGAVSLLLTLTTAALCWRGVAPMLGRFAIMPLPYPDAAGGAWAAPDVRPGGEGLIVNVTEAVKSGGASVSSPTGAQRGPDAFVDLRWLTVADAQQPERGPAGTSRREWLYMHPPSDVSLNVALPANRETWFAASLALDPRVWDSPIGDGVRYAVTVTPQPSGSAEIALDVAINPRAYAAHRKWVPVEADLSRWAGQTVRLTLRTLPRDELSFDWAGWSNPVVYVRDVARDRLPTTAPHN